MESLSFNPSEVPDFFFNPYNHQSQVEVIVSDFTTLMSDISRKLCGHFLRTHSLKPARCALSVHVCQPGDSCAAARRAPCVTAA